MLPRLFRSPDWALLRADYNSRALTTGRRITRIITALGRDLDLLKGEANYGGSRRLRNLLYAEQRSRCRDWYQRPRLRRADELAYQLPEQQFRAVGLFERSVPASSPASNRIQQWAPHRCRIRISRTDSKLECAALRTDVELW